MITKPKTSNDYEGITPLHLAILNENEMLIDKMAESLKCIKVKKSYQKNMKRKYERKVLYFKTP
jgi:ankyrin repeat protein